MNKSTQGGIVFFWQEVYNHPQLSSAGRKIAINMRRFFANLLGDMTVKSGSDPRKSYTGCLGFTSQRYLDEFLKGRSYRPEECSIRKGSSTTFVVMDVGCIEDFMGWLGSQVPSGMKGKKKTWRMLYEEVAGIVKEEADARDGDADEVKPAKEQAPTASQASFLNMGNHARLSAIR